MVLVSIRKIMDDGDRFTKFTYEDGKIYCSIKEDIYRGYAGHPGREVLKRKLHDSASMKRELTDKEVLRFVNDYEHTFKEEIRQLMLQVERDIKLHEVML